MIFSFYSIAITLIIGCCLNLLLKLFKTAKNMVIITIMISKAGYK